MSIIRIAHITDGERRKGNESRVERVEVKRAVEIDDKFEYT